MSEFDYDFLPEPVSGVYEIQTLGLSPDLLGQIQPDDARRVLLSMGTALQKVAHPDMGNTGWTGPESGDITLATSRIKSLSDADFALALSTFVNNATGIRQSQFNELRRVQEATNTINIMLGGAVLEVVAKSNDAYSQFSGTIFSDSIWGNDKKRIIYESKLRLRMQDGVVTSADQLIREGVLVEMLPKAYQKPLKAADTLMSDDDSKLVVVADNGNLLITQDPNQPNLLTETDISLPDVQDFPLRGSIIMLRNSVNQNDPTDIRLGARIYSDNSSSTLKKLVGAIYVGKYNPQAQIADLSTRVRPEISQMIKKAVISGEVRQALLTKDQLQVLIANGIIALRRGHMAGNKAGMVLLTKDKNKPVAFLPGEQLTINN